MTKQLAMLGLKTLVMVVGPAAVGKSALMHAVCDIDERFAYVRSFTTRPDRGDGKSTYRHVSEAEAATIKQTGRTVTFLRHPTTGHAYGTTIESFSGDYNLLDTLSSSVDAYRNLPFRRTITISLTTEPDAWQAWLLERYPHASEERTKRLKEAIESIEWSLRQTDDNRWLVNTPGDLQETATRLIKLVMNDRTPTATIPSEAKALLERAKDLLLYQ